MISGCWAGILTILSINIVFAYGIYLAVATGRLNLGGAGFRALGAYAAAWFSVEYGLPIRATPAASALVAGAFGPAPAFPILRLKGGCLVRGTFAFAEAAASAILNSEALGGAMGLPAPEYIDWHAPVCAAIAVAALRFHLMSTRFGLAARSVHDDDVVSDPMGVPVRGVRAAAFAFGAALAGGALCARLHLCRDPGVQRLALGLRAALRAARGGRTARGPILGAAFFTLPPEAMRSAPPAAKEAIWTAFGAAGAASPPDESWRFVILGAAAILMTIFRPEGLVARRGLERLTHPMRKEASERARFFGWRTCPSASAG